VNASRWHQAQNTNQNSGTAKVFIASVTEEFRAQRRALNSILRAGGHTPWLYELSAGASHKSALRRCFDEISNCDIVVALMGRELGPSIEHSAISFSEAEILEAERLGKPLLVYCRRNNNLGDFPTATLLTHLQDELTGHTVYSFRSTKELCNRVNDDIREVLHGHGGPLEPPWSARLASIMEWRTPKELPTDQGLEDAAVAFGALYRAGDFHAAERLGEALAPQMLRISQEEHYWPIVHPFLSQYHHVLAVRGQLLGEVSAATVAKAHRQLALQIGDLPAAVTTTSALGAIYLLAGRNDSGKRWSDWALARSQILAEPSAVYDVLTSFELARHSYTTAHRYARQAIDLFDGNRFDRGYLVGRLAGVEHESGAFPLDRAAETVESALLLADVDNVSRVDILAYGLQISLSQGDRQRTRELRETIRAICVKKGYRLPLRNLDLNPKD